MNQLILALGLVLLAIVVIDLLWTTLWVEGGAGPLTSIFMTSAWRIIRPFKAIDSRILTSSGPIILTFGLVMWIVLLWGGWAFIFASGEGAITDTVNKDPISWSDSIYFAGYAIFTLGNGDFAPREGFWQLMTTLATASGMLLITLSVTYIVNVLSAVTQKRSFASNVSGLGEQGTDVLLRSWNGDDFEGLELPLNTITTQLNTLTLNHKAYPILHYFHSK